MPSATPTCSTYDRRRNHRRRRGETARRRRIRRIRAGRGRAPRCCCPRRSANPIRSTRRSVASMRSSCPAEATFIPPNTGRRRAPRWTRWIGERDRMELLALRTARAHQQAGTRNLPRRTTSRRRNGRHPDSGPPRRGPPRTLRREPRPRLRHPAARHQGRSRIVCGSRARRSHARSTRTIIRRSETSATSSSPRRGPTTESSRQSRAQASSGCSGIQKPCSPPTIAISNHSAGSLAQSREHRT